MFSEQFYSVLHFVLAAVRFSGGNDVCHGQVTDEKYEDDEPRPGAVRGAQKDD